MTTPAFPINIPGPSASSDQWTAAGDQWAANIFNQSNGPVANQLIPAGSPPVVDITTLQEFISFAKNNAFARKSRFAVQINFPAGIGNISSAEGAFGNHLGLLCEEASLPGKNIHTRKLRINALDEYRAHTQDFTGEDIKFQFLVDAKWGIRRFFENWIEYAGGTYGSRELNFYEKYVGTIHIASLSPQTLSQGANTNALGGVTASSPEKSQYIITLREAWPKSINAQSLSSSAEGYHRLEVTFAFKYWINQYDAQIVQTG